MNKTNHAINWIVIYPVDSVIQPLNNRVLVFSHMPVMARLFNPVFQPIQPPAIRATYMELTTVCLRVFERVDFNFICCRSTLAVCTAALLAGLEMATILFIH